MRKALTAIVFLTTILVSCKKETTAPVVENEINVNATAEITSAAGNTVWKSKATVNKSMSTTAYVKLQYDVYNGTNAMQYSVVDTVTINAGFFNGTRVTNHATALNWTAKNVKVLSAWCSNSSYIFKY